MGDSKGAFSISQTRMACNCILPVGLSLRGHAGLSQDTYREGETVKIPTKGVWGHAWLYLWVSSNESSTKLSKIVSEHLLKLSFGSNYVEKYIEIGNENQCLPFLF